MKKILLLALFIGQVFALTNIKAIKTNIINLQKQNIPIIDIRLPMEWESTGVIPKSIKLTFFNQRGEVNPNFLTELKKHHINKNSKFAIICRTGHRTAIASKLLTKYGYKNLINLEGGMFNLFKDLLKEVKYGK